MIGTFFVSDLRTIHLEHPAELTLGRSMVKLTEQLLQLEADLYPHGMCDYIYDLSQKFNQFYVPRQ
jgi:arginyl-tRNA synthetase